MVWLVKDIHNLVNILGAQAVLVSVLQKALAGIDHEDACTDTGVLLVDDQNTGRDAGAVEEIGGQADDSFNEALPNKPSADVSLPVSAKQHAVRQDDGAFAPAIKRRDEV